MEILLREFNVNSNTFTTFGAIIVIALVLVIHISGSFWVQRIRVVNFAILIEWIMLGYLIIFMFLVNAPNSEATMQYSRLLYTVFIILGMSSLISTYFITNKKSWCHILLAGVVGIVLVVMMYGNETWMITREVRYGTYALAVKGPFFFLILLYYFALTTYQLVDLLRLFFKNRRLFQEVWLFYFSMLFYGFYSTIQGILLNLNPNIRPTLYLNTLVFAVLLNIYVFKKVHDTITERESYYRAYIFDELSQVYTRSYTLETLNQHLEKAHLHNHFVVMIDIDNFKKLNDQYGHLFGDQVLKSFGHILNRLPRLTALSGRLGGDEFLIIFNELERVEVQKSLDNMRREYQLVLSGLGVDLKQSGAGLSIGYIELMAGMKQKEVLTRVDQAMYAAKSLGKNQIIFKGRKAV